MSHQITLNANNFTVEIDPNVGLAPLDDFMVAVQDGWAKEIENIAKEHGVPDGFASEIWYERTRARWTQDHEDALIRLGKSYARALRGA